MTEVFVHMQLTGANCECNGHVWRMDVGMSGGVLNALPQVTAYLSQVLWGQLGSTASFASPTCLRLTTSRFSELWVPFVKTLV